MFALGGCLFAYDRKSSKRKWSCSAHRRGSPCPYRQSQCKLVVQRLESVYKESAEISPRLIEHAVVRVRYIVCLGRESRDSTVYHGAASAT